MAAGGQHVRLQAGPLCSCYIGPRGWPFGVSLFLPYALNTNGKHDLCGFVRVRPMCWR
jgi:hypothetical protein